MTRITERDLQAVCDRINRIMGTPMKPYEKVGDKYVAQIGNYHLDHAYGGVNLVQMVNEGGGITCPLGQGHDTKRDLYNKMHAFINGLESKRAA
jgi:hypothetical protein